MYVEGITDRCDWEITGKTIGELGKKLAARLMELAEYLKDAASFLDDQSNRIRLETEYEARRWPE